MQGKCAKTDLCYTLTLWLCVAGNNSTLSQPFLFMIGPALDSIPTRLPAFQFFCSLKFANSCDGIDDVHYYCCASVWDRVALFLCCESVCCLTPLSEPRQSLDLVVCLSPVKLILLSNIPLHASKRDVCYPCFFFCGGLWCQLVMYIWYTNIYCCGDNKFGNLEVGN
jgi:hypothetical protein